MQLESNDNAYYTNNLSINKQGMERHTGGIPTRIATQDARLPQGYNNTENPPTLYKSAN